MSSPDERESVEGLEGTMFSASANRWALGEDEGLEALMADACRDALIDSALAPSDVDRLYGYAQVSRFVSPNGLFGLHRQLGLRSSAWVVPIANDFANFLTAVALAHEAILAGGARVVLVACGAHMSPHVEPGSGYARSIGDAAAAAVVGPGARDVILDHATHTASELYAAATISTDGAGPPSFRLDPAGLGAVHDYGIGQPVALTKALLARNDIRADEIALVAHQPSRVLMDQWRHDIAPGQYLETYDEIGNATLASVPFTLAMRRDAIDRPYVLLMSPGTGMHTVALLLRCGALEGGAR